MEHLDDDGRTAAAKRLRRDGADIRPADPRDGVRPADPRDGAARRTADARADASGGTAEVKRIRRDRPQGACDRGDSPPADLPAVLAHARSARRPGPDTPAGPRVPAWPGRPSPLPEAGPGRLDLGGLLRLSLAASDGSGRLRPVPSAGALHPVDTELVVGAGCSLPPGRYGYDPLRHRVHRLGREPDGTPPGVTVELSVTARRTVSHYGHRAWPLLLLDTGHAAGAVVLAARALGAGAAEARLDEAAARPLAAVRVPAPAPTSPATAHPPGRASTSPATTHPPGRTPTSAATTHPSVRPSTSPATAHLPGRPPTSPATAHPSGRTPASPAITHPPGRTPTPRELLARRSTPPPLPHTAPAPEALRAVLDSAVHAGGAELRWCVAVGAPEPCLLEPAPGGGPPRRFAAGEARPTLAAWAGGQAWLADAGAVLLARGCPVDADAAHIVRTHLRAGFAVHLAHVTALRHGLAARPVGSWQQADLGAALGAPPGQDWIVHGLALGAFPTTAPAAPAGSRPFPAALPVPEEKNPA
ncbi:SagB/ThcOx family dehydrogenase [Streptomyces sp. NPDC085466]|uniref:SagB/ThcOx family dehydrogenase n=1 Tax=Streptomyces sp. NPDC085466 TaxID=3365725 RepID=UPI0037CFA03A